MTKTQRGDFKVHSYDGTLRGTFPCAEDAAMFVACLGRGACVRYRGRVVWEEGKEKPFGVGRFLAGESYDYAAEVMLTSAGLK